MAVHVVWTASTITEKKKKKKHNMSGDSTGAKSAGHLTLVIALMDGLGWISCSAYALLSFSVKFM